MMDQMKRQMLDGTDWTTDGMGTLICPHGHRCEDDQRAGLAECGCVSPLVRAGLI